MYGDQHFSETGSELEMNIYYIGGSPCAGKSSVAEIVSRLQESHQYECGAGLDAGTVNPMQRGI